MSRILHVISGLAVGGAEMAMYRLVAHADAARHEHAVVTLTRGGAIGRRLREVDIELFELDFRRAPITGFFRLAALMRRQRPDIVQTWMYHADLFGGLAARLAGSPPVIWGVHTTRLGSGNARATRLVRRLCAWSSGVLPDAIVCVAEAARKACIEAGYAAQRIVVIPNGFDLRQLAATPAQRSELRRQCGFAEDELVIGSIGRFNADKDPRNFVCAAGLLAVAHPRARFLMVGKGLDRGNAELAGWIEQTGCADRFVLLGERRDVPACLAAMDVFCLHSRTEAFPLVVGEAMAMGLPCAVTDVGDAALLVADTGVVVPKEDIAALADGLARLCEMGDAQRRRLGREAQARIRDEFAIERTCERYEALYARLSARNGRPAGRTDTEKEQAYAEKP
jgi:glycosyltransferase involved in cell wall biosynthesis